MNPKEKYNNNENTISKQAQDQIFVPALISYFSSITEPNNNCILLFVEATVHRSIQLNSVINVSMSAGHSLTCTQS